MIERNLSRRDASAGRRRRDRLAVALVIGAALAVVIWARTVRTAKVGMPGSMPPPPEAGAPGVEAEPDDPGTMTPG